MSRQSENDRRSTRFLRTIAGSVALAFVVAGPATAGGGHEDHDRSHRHDHGHAHHHHHHGEKHDARHGKSKHHRADEREHGGSHGPARRHEPRVVYRDVEHAPDHTGREAAGGTVSPGGLIGAAIGGIVGAQIGKGDGRLASVAAGALAGYLLGEQIERASRAQPHIRPQPRVDEPGPKVTRISWR